MDANLTWGPPPPHTGTECRSVAQAVTVYGGDPLLKIDGGALPLSPNSGKAEPTEPDYYSKEIAACFLCMHLLGSSLFTLL